MRNTFRTTLCILILCISFCTLPPPVQAQIIPEEALELKEEGIELLCAETWKKQCVFMIRH